MKISVIFGTRPEAIKLAPVILALRQDRRFQCHVCVTAQHRQMLDQVLDVFGIQPEVDLNLMQPGQSLSSLTARALEALDGYLAGSSPDLVLVQGDTTTVLCAALAAFYRKVPTGHVEAGLRTGNMEAPWPEEANRALTSRLAALHFAPTETSRQNLLREGIDPTWIRVTGNPAVDALYLALEKVQAHPPPIPELPPVWQGHSKTDLAHQADRIVLITGHRRESFGEGFESICQAIAALADRFPDCQFVYPVHLNPKVQEPVFRILAAPRPASARAGSSARSNIHLIEPLPYLSFVRLMEMATIILTDSGGIQEEAPSLGKPVLVMRETTERPEALETGLIHLVGTDQERIVAEATQLLQVGAGKSNRCPTQSGPGAGGRYPNPFGDGKAAERIVAGCAEFLGLHHGRK